MSGGGKTLKAEPSNRPNKSGGSTAALIFGLIVITAFVAKHACSDLHSKPYEYSTAREVSRQHSDGASWWARMLCVFNDPRDNLRKWYRGFYQPDDALFRSVSSASALRAFNIKISGVFQSAETTGYLSHLSPILAYR